MYSTWKNKALSTWLYPCHYFDILIKKELRVTGVTLHNKTNWRDQCWDLGETYLSVLVLECRPVKCFGFSDPPT